jgi:Arc/MetJ family transcription regulator
MVKHVRKKINITIDETLLAELQKEMKKKNLSLSRLIENKLKGIE